MTTHFLLYIVVDIIYHWDYRKLVLGNFDYFFTSKVAHRKIKFFLRIKLRLGNFKEKVMLWVMP